MNNFKSVFINLVILIILYLVATAHIVFLQFRLSKVEEQVKFLDNVYSAWIYGASSIMSATDTTIIYDKNSLFWVNGRGQIISSVTGDTVGDIGKDCFYKDIIYENEQFNKISDE